MRLFYLDRHIDDTGVSGTGRVAEGVEFSNGKVALTWLTGHNTVTVYDSIEETQTIHCHNNHTTINFINGLLKTEDYPYNIVP